MPMGRRSLELSVERALAGSRDRSGELVRLSARFEIDPGGSGPTLAELAEALATLRSELSSAVGPEEETPGRPERELAELVETYHPRQIELLDLLREEAELTAREHRVLTEYLTSRPAHPPDLATPARAVPAGALAGPASAARPVEELIREHHIESLRQAGAVRARRKISFDEYMALKQFFEERDRSPSAADPAR